jgi:ABC-type branched-subunit amino acid transport system ATPase component
MALMRHVSLLLLDEPVAGLSPESASMLLKGLGALRLSEGFAMILVEHRLRAIQSYVNRVVIMIDGEACEDTRDTSILSDLARLERYYRL